MGMPLQHVVPAISRLLNSHRIRLPSLSSLLSPHNYHRTHRIVHVLNVSFPRTYARHAS